MKRLPFLAPSGLLFLAGMLCLNLFAAPNAALAQDDAQPQPTPTPDLANGLEIYDARCANCHGPQGGGDGELAPNLPNPPTAFNEPGYAEDVTRDAIFAVVTQGRAQQGMPPFGPSSSNPLTEQERWDVVEAVLSFSEPAVPIELVTITGDVVNGTSAENVTSGDVVLRAFTPQIEQVFSETAAVSADGSFAFEVTDAPPNWVYVVSTDYGDLSFSSTPARASESEATLSLPVTVYEATTDSAVVSIEQIHGVIDFVEDRVRVNEVYVFNNDSNTVFVGETGNPAEGTVTVAVPAGAENVEFQRSFSSFENFMDAEDVIQTELGYADVVTLRPGGGALTLLVRYELPFSNGLTIAHPVDYSVARASATMPDVGVTLSEEEWTVQEPTNMGAAGLFLNYLRPGLAANQALSYVLEGQPRTVTDSTGNTVAVRDETAELLIGGLALLAAIAVAVVAVRSWQPSAEIATAAPIDTPAERQRMLAAIAHLDDAYEAGGMDSAEYEQRRTELLNQLAAIWPKPTDPDEDEL